MSLQWCCEKREGMKASRKTEARTVATVVPEKRRDLIEILFSNVLQGLFGLIRNFVLIKDTSESC